MSMRSRDQVLLLEDVEKCEKEVVEALLARPDGGHATILINSGGGSVYAGLGIGTVIRHKRLHCHAIVLADCSSSALLVFAACQTREVAPHASFLFHPMQWSSDERSRLNGARSWSEEFQRVVSVSEDWLAELLPMPKSVLRKWVQQEKYITASEMIERGLAAPLSLHSTKILSVPRPSKARTASKAPARTTARIRKVG